MDMPTIGSTVWIFDVNRRVYRDGAGGGPIWREHWRPEKIEGETSRSWITTYGTKVPKKGADPREVAFDLVAIERAAYIHENAYGISEEVRRLTSYDLLQQIATLIGYRPK